MNSSDVSSVMLTYIDRYDHGVASARRRFYDDQAIQLLKSPEIGASHLEAFYIYFCAFGVGMTQPVEGWIRQAGEACIAVGQPKLGKALIGHAKAEADHHLLMIEDLGQLCQRRKGAGRAAPTAEYMLALDWPDSVHRYRRMHEDVIAGSAPYAQIAIENEIEMLSVGLGPDLLNNASALLGSEFVTDLSFLTEHVELDAGHTKFNRRQMAAFLEVQDSKGTASETVDALVMAGTEALDAYRAFLSDCVTRSRAANAGSCEGWA